MLESDQLLVISERKRCGLILCGPYIAVFVGPGAAIGPKLEQQYEQVIEIGTPELVPVTTHAKRQTAISRRIQWIRWLQNITRYPEPLVRAEKLLSGFEAFFESQAIATIPDEALAMLIGVLPSTIRSVRPANTGLQSPVYLTNGPWITSQETALGKCEAADRILSSFPSEAATKSSKFISALRQPISA